MPWIDWYNSLAKPSWTPAPATIGLIWQILYPIILVSFGFVFVQAFRKASAVAGRLAVRHQPRGEPDLHADPVRDAKPAAGGGGHPDRVDHDHLDGVVAIWPHYRWVAVAQVPYFVWVSLATVLQLSITAMNWGRP